MTVKLFQKLSKTNHIYGYLTYNSIEYKLIFGHPYDMLKDTKISWEAKGYLSYLANLEDDLDVSDCVILELINHRYLVEVGNE